MNASKVIAKLTRAGFEQVRQKGSHVVLKNGEGRIVVVPVHKGELIDRTLLMRIAEQAGLTRDEFLAL